MCVCYITCPSWLQVTNSTCNTIQAAGKRGYKSNNAKPDVRSVLRWKVSITKNETLERKDKRAGMHRAKDGRKQSKI